MHLSLNSSHRRELARGLRNLGLTREPIQAPTSGAEPGTADVVFTLRVDKQIFTHPEAYEITQEHGGSKWLGIRLSGSTPQAVLYAVFDFLERQGAFFGLYGETYPLDPVGALNIPPANQPWRAQPRFDTRGFLLFPDFIQIFDREGYRAYLEAMVRMRLNTLSFHVYNGVDKPSLAFEYSGVGYLTHCDASTTTSFSYLPQRTSRYGMGAGDFFAGEVFGPEVTRTAARNAWEEEEFAEKVRGEAFRYARQLGIRTGIGFEVDSVPEEILRAVPPEAHFVTTDPNLPGPKVDPESMAARDILDIRLGRLLETYPEVDHVWLWEGEGSSWVSRSGNVPLSITPFKQAYDFLRRHTPGKRLVVAGWGGVARHFAYFHKQLPQDVIFSSLSDTVGWEPVSEEYGKLEGRERWPIPWLEDDPAMWFPQFHVHRLREDIDRAEKLGCQGLMTMHWHDRILDVNVGLQSRYSWDKTLEPTTYFRNFASAHVRQPRAGELARVLEETDEKQLLLSSFTGEIKDGYHELHEYSGDYNEAFTFWNGYEPSQEVKDSQAEVARRLRALAEAASSAAERERLSYWTLRIEFLVRYAESWSLAFHLHQTLQEAGELKKQGRLKEAREKVMSKGIPLWLRLAPLVREALLNFHETVCTPNDLEMLVAMHNKYERLALFRLRASMKEYLGDLPPEVEKMYQIVRQPDPSLFPRVFVPTRPSALTVGESVRVYAVAPGGSGVERVTLFTRPAGSKRWVASAMKLVGRRTFVGELEAREGFKTFLDYYVNADFVFSKGTYHATAPLEAPERFYSATLL